MAQRAKDGTSGIGEYSFNFRDQDSEEHIYNTMRGRAQDVMRRIVNDISNPTGRAKMATYAEGYENISSEWFDIIGDGVGLTEKGATIFS